MTSSGSTLVSLARVHETKKNLLPIFASLLFVATVALPSSASAKIGFENKELPAATFIESRSTLSELMAQPQQKDAPQQENAGAGSLAQDAGALNANIVAPSIINKQPTSASEWLVTLLGGLVGGLILNLMPCVFPVLAIKVMGFTKHGSNKRAHRQAGLAYTAGVVLSFLALSGLLLGLRAAGEHIGWGFQLQSPVVVAVLAALFTLIGLNLAGVFEFGQFAPTRLAKLQAKHPVVDAFLTGILAVAIASPCTAPFMGASLGLAVEMPAAQALLVFASLGMGMALPYLAASWFPMAVSWMPRPGAWMETFRRGMAFPMFATVAWLLWVLGQQRGIDGFGALLVLLVAGSSVVWALTLSGRTRWVLASALLALSAWLVAAVGPHVIQADIYTHPASE